MGLIKDILASISALQENAIRFVEGDNNRCRTHSAAGGGVMIEVDDPPGDPIQYAYVYGLYNVDKTAWVFPSSNTANKTPSKGYPVYCTAFSLQGGIPLSGGNPDETKALKILLTPGVTVGRPTWLFDSLNDGKTVGGTDASKWQIIAYLPLSAAAGYDGQAIPMPAATEWSHAGLDSGVQPMIGRATLTGAFYGLDGSAFTSAQVYQAYADATFVGPSGRTQYLHLALPPGTRDLLGSDSGYGYPTYFVAFPGDDADNAGTRVDGAVLPIPYLIAGGGVIGSAAIFSGTSTWQSGFFLAQLQDTSGGASPGSNTTAAGYTYDINPVKQLSTPGVGSLVQIGWQSLSLTPIFQRPKGKTKVGTWGIVYADYGAGCIGGVTLLPMTPTYRLICTDECPDNTLKTIAGTINVVAGTCSVQVLTNTQ